MTGQRELQMDLATPLERAEAHLRHMAQRYEAVVERVYGKVGSREQEDVARAHANYVAALQRVDELRLERGR